MSCLFPVGKQIFYFNLSGTYNQARAKFGEAVPAGAGDSVIRGGSESVGDQGLPMWNFQF